MPDPSPEALRTLALTALDWAYAYRHAAHGVGLFAMRAQPTLEETIVQQRTQILKIAEGLLEQEFIGRMDQLTECWTSYRKTFPK